MVLRQDGAEAAVENAGGPSFQSQPGKPIERRMQEECLFSASLGSRPSGNAGEMTLQCQPAQPSMPIEGRALICSS
jgi:hypothetical protein